MQETTGVEGKQKFCSLNYASSNLQLLRWNLNNYFLSFERLYESSLRFLLLSRELELIGEERKT